MINLSTKFENSYRIIIGFSDDKNDEKSQTTLLELEAIDDDTSKNGIPFVKIADLDVAATYGIGELPALVYFEKKVPNFYQGYFFLHSILSYTITQKFNCC